MKIIALFIIGVVAACFALIAMINNDEAARRMRLEERERYAEDPVDYERLGDRMDRHAHELAGKFNGSDET